MNMDELNDLVWPQQKPPNATTSMNKTSSNVQNSPFAGLGNLGTSQSGTTPTPALSWQNNTISPLRPQPQPGNTSAALNYNISSSLASQANMNRPSSTPNTNTANIAWSSTTNSKTANAPVKASTDVFGEFASFGKPSNQNLSLDAQRRLKEHEQQQQLAKQQSMASQAAGQLGDISFLEKLTISPQTPTNPPLSAMKPMQSTPPLSLQSSVNQQNKEVTRSSAGNTPVSGTSSSLDAFANLVTPMKTASTATPLKASSPLATATDTIKTQSHSVPVTGNAWDFDFLDVGKLNGSGNVAKTPSAGATDAFDLLGNLAAPIVTERKVSEPEKNEPVVAPVILPASSNPAAVIPTSSKPVESNPAIEQMLAMGFTREASQAALTACHGDAQVAIDLLLQTQPRQGGAPRVNSSSNNASSTVESAWSFGKSLFQKASVVAAAAKSKIESKLVDALDQSGFRGSSSSLERRPHSLHDEEDAANGFVQPSWKNAEPEPVPMASSKPVQAAFPVMKGPVLPPAPVVAEPVLVKVTATAEQLAACKEHQQKATMLRKQGDYIAAAGSYSSAIDALPEGHLDSLDLLVHRAACHLENGSAKSALVDVQQVLEIRPNWSKGLWQRGAVYEAMECWSEAAQDYSVLARMEPGDKINRALARVARAQRVEAKARDEPHSNSSNNNNGNINVTSDLDFLGAATTTSSSQFTSATSALSNGPAPTLDSVRSKNVAISAMQDQAVAQLRAKDEAQERDEQQRLQCKDAVDAKILAWRKGKETNLRALLTSVDGLLWPALQWQAPNLADLVQPNRCKVQYMKAIAKLHPDKLASSTTVEQRMIAGAVFAALNEAWDAFKVQNNL